MTIKEAHAYLEDLQREYTSNRKAYANDLIEANGKAIEALEKQIPKKPKRISNDLGIFGTMVGYISPCCGIALGIRHDGDPEPIDYFCPNCGQAIDWSDIDV